MPGKRVIERIKDFALENSGKDGFPVLFVGRDQVEDKTAISKMDIALNAKIKSTVINALGSIRYGKYDNFTPQEKFAFSNKMSELWSSDDADDRMAAMFFCVAAKAPGFQIKHPYRKNSVLVQDIAREIVGQNSSYEDYRSALASGFFKLREDAFAAQNARLNDVWDRVNNAESEWTIGESQRMRASDMEDESIKVDMPAFADIAEMPQETQEALAEAALRDIEKLTTPRAEGMSYRMADTAELLNRDHFGSQQESRVFANTDTVVASRTNVGSDAQLDTGAVIAETARQETVSPTETPMTNADTASIIPEEMQPSDADFADFVAAAPKGGEEFAPQAMQVATPEITNLSVLAVDENHFANEAFSKAKPIMSDVVAKQLPNEPSEKEAKESALADNTATKPSTEEQSAQKNLLAEKDAEIANLQKQLAELRAMNESLQAENQRMRQENALAQQNNELMRQRIEMLRRENELLKQENEMLAQNAQLREQNSALKQETPQIVTLSPSEGRMAVSDDKSLKSKGVSATLKEASQTEEQPNGNAEHAVAQAVAQSNQKSDSVEATVQPQAQAIREDEAQRNEVTTVAKTETTKAPVLKYRQIDEKAFQTELAHAEKRNARLKQSAHDKAIQNLKAMEEQGLLAVGPNGESNAEVYLYRLYQSKLFYDLKEKVKMSDGSWKRVETALASESGKNHREVLADLMRKDLSPAELKDYARTVSLTDGCITAKGSVKRNHQIPVRANTDLAHSQQQEAEQSKSEKSADGNPKLTRMLQGVSEREAEQESATPVFRKAGKSSEIC